MENEKKEFSTYSIIPTEIMLNKELPSTAKILYGIISSLTNEKGYCWASNKYLGDLICITERQVSKNITKLDNLGYIISDINKNFKRKIKLTTIIGGRKKSSKGLEQKFQGGGTKVLYNNIKEYNNSNINILAGKPANNKIPINKGENNKSELSKQLEKIGIKTVIENSRENPIGSVCLKNLCFSK